MRQRDPLTLEEARELDALERALAGEPVDADLHELEALVVDIRATAPQMSPGFAARLEHEVEEGFPASQEQPARRPSRRWVLIPAAGTLAAVLVALVVVLGQSGSDDSAPGIANTLQERGAEDSAETSGRASKPASPSAATESAPSGGGVSATADPARPPALSAAPPPRTSAPPVTKSGQPRRVQRNADLVLRVPTAKLESTADGVNRTADRFGGIVAASTVNVDDSTGGEASFDLRIPTERLDDALAALSKLGHVAERRQGLVDITGSFESAQDRLSDARAERRGLLRALGRASTKAQIDSLRARLRTVRSQIARLNGDLEALRRRADLSSVSVVVRGGGTHDDGDSGSGGDWTPGDAARDALRVLEVIAGVALIALAVMAPLALLAAVVALAVRAQRRRRREGALDPA